MSVYAKQTIEVPPDVSTSGFAWYRADSLVGSTWELGASFFAGPGFARELWTYFKWIAKRSGKQLKMKLTRMDSDGVGVVAYFDSAAPAKGYDPPEVMG
jgi:hypothetical protein